MGGTVVTSDLTASGSAAKSISLAERLSALRQQAGLSEVLLFRVTSGRNGQRMQRLLRVPDDGESRPVTRSVHKALHVAVDMAHPFITMRRERHRDEHEPGADGQLSVVMIAPILTTDRVIWGALVGIAPQGATSADAFRSVIQSAELIGGQVSSWGRMPTFNGEASIGVEPEFSMTSSAALLHELRTPLTASVFALDLLNRGDYFAPDEEAAYRAMRTLRLAIEEAINIMQWWEEAQKKGHIKPQLKPIALRAALHQALALSERPAREFHVTISDATPLVLADEHMLNRIFLNLIENAFLHGQPGGTLEISTSAASGHVRVRFQNEGAIPETSLQHILYLTPKKDIQSLARGHGYGLGIVKALLNMMNGSLQVESDTQHWTAFTVTLPAALPERAAEM